MPLRNATSPDQALTAAAPTRRRYAIFIVLLTLLLHWSALEWAKRQTGSALHDTPAVLQASLHAAPTEPPPAPKPPPRKPTPHHPAPRKPTSPRPQATAPTPVAEPAPASTPNIDASTADAYTPEPAFTSPTGDDATPTDNTNARYKVAPPPSAELNYDVEALREGQKVYGHGKIAWGFGDGSYTIYGEAGVLFFTVLNFTSAGGIDEYGIAPVRYTEKPFRKSAVATHFTRERNTLSFSASTLTYPLKGGEQDRASIIWQLASIGRGEPEKFAANAQFPIFVAGTRDGEMWNIQVIGEESIATGVGPLTTWHLVRLPRAGSYDKQLDIWLAPQRDWYPVRLRYTEANGEYLDMAVSSIGPLTR